MQDYKTSNRLIQFNSLNIVIIKFWTIGIKFPSIDCYFSLLDFKDHFAFSSSLGR